jgi:hypothetical protein
MEIGLIVNNRTPSFVTTSFLPETPSLKVMRADAREYKRLLSLEEVGYTIEQIAATVSKTVVYIT